jgi:hypothetical protein
MRSSEEYYTLARCPLCGGRWFPDSSCTDYEYAFRKNLDHIATSESDRAREFSYLAEIMYEIRDRLFGVSVGSVQEKISVIYLKQACPLDHFSEELASKHGTDIVASVMEGETCMGKISISVKKQKKWNPDFLDQLEKNIRTDQTRWGLLITSAFPNEALNENIWTARTYANRMVLIVKPEFAPTAYFAIRQMVVYESLAGGTVQKKLVRAQKLIPHQSSYGSSKLGTSNLTSENLKHARKGAV